MLPSSRKQIWIAYPPALVVAVAAHVIALHAAIVESSPFLPDGTLIPCFRSNDGDAPVRTASKLTFFSFVGACKSASSS
jgi:hypothetical protein